MAKKSKKQALPSEFETMVVAACLADKLVRGGYGAEPAPAALAADVAAWRKHARTASEAMGHKAGRAK